MDKHWEAELKGNTRYTRKQHFKINRTEITWIVTSGVKITERKFGQNRLGQSINASWLCVSLL